MAVRCLSCDVGAVPGVTMARDRRLSGMSPLSGVFYGFCTGSTVDKFHFCRRCDDIVIRLAKDWGARQLDRADDHP